MCPELGGPCDGFLLVIRSLTGRGFWLTAARAVPETDAVLRLRRRVAIIAALIAMSAFAPPASAADAPPGEPGEAAIQRGIRLRKAGDDAGALPEFQAGYQLAHTPRAAAQLGLVEQALGHWDDAEVHLTEAVRTTGDAWVEKNRTALQKSLAVVKDHVGTLQVTGEPEGAEIYVNGGRRGQIPMSKPITVMAGDVDVEVRASGYKRAAQKVTIAAFAYRPLVIRLERLEAANASAVDAGPAAGKDDHRTDATAPNGPALAARSAAEPAPAATAVAPGAPVVTKDERRGAVWPIVGWSVAGAGAVTAAVGVAEALAGQSKIDAASTDADRANATANPTLYMSAATKFSDGSSQRTTGRVLMIAGGAAVVAGVVVALTTSHGSDAAANRVARWQPSIDLEPGRLASARLSVVGLW